MSTVLLILIALNVVFGVTVYGLLQANIRCLGFLNNSKKIIRENQDYKVYNILVQSDEPVIEQLLKINRFLLTTSLVTFNINILVFSLTLYPDLIIFNDWDNLKYIVVILNAYLIMSFGRLARAKTVIYSTYQAYKVLLEGYSFIKDNNNDSTK